MKNYRKEHVRKNVERNAMKSIFEINSSQEIIRKNFRVKFDPKKKDEPVSV